VDVALVADATEPTHDLFHARASWEREGKHIVHKRTSVHYVMFRSAFDARCCNVCDDAEMNDAVPPQPILIVGATGYIGGRLLRRLEGRCQPVRCLARRPEYLRARAAATTEVVTGDLLDPETLPAALAGIGVAYYLAHSMGSGTGFERAERQSAEHFARAAVAAGVSRIIYLGALAHGDALSPHLASRQAVGRVLRESGVPTIEFRASVIIGSGSLSYELFRALTEKLPVMTTPRWVRTRTQPIAVEDVLDYLVAAAEIDLADSVVYEIGGADRVSYEALMQEYARQRGLRRWIVPVPVLSPRISSLWLGLVTPVYARVGRKLIDSLRNESIVHDSRALEDFPIRPRGMVEAIQRALANEDEQFATTRWNDALSMQGPPARSGGVTFGQRIVDSRAIQVRATPEQAFTPIRRIGGRTGWYYGNWLWRLRGFMDLAVGGAGLRRGRLNPEVARPGDTIDFWRVEAYEPDRLLRLVAEMRLPGRAWLQFEVESHDGGALVRQTALYDPVGVRGLAYWYLLYPVHRLVFRGMLRGIVRAIPNS
jgi:uncharacterized protein YbjT (DUF2867 family)